MLACKFDQYTHIHICLRAHTLLQSGIILCFCCKVVCFAFFSKLLRLRVHVPCLPMLLRIFTIINIVFVVVTLHLLLLKLCSYKLVYTPDLHCAPLFFLFLVFHAFLLIFFFFLFCKVCHSASIVCSSVACKDTN